MNALPGTYLGNAVVQDSATSAFETVVFEPATDDMTESNGLPTFAMNVTGVADKNAYYLLDFTSDVTVLWNQNCTHAIMGVYPEGSCALNPTLMSLGFSESNNATGLLHRVGAFNNLKTGGYVVSGTRYQTELCLQNGDCKIGVIYSGETVTQDNWHYN